MGNFYKVFFAILVALLSVNSLQLYAQENRITGKVTDAEDGSGIPGVNIVERGTTIGTVTDLDGNYALTVTGPDAVLVFSFVGYTPREVEVRNQSAIDVALALDIQSLQEIVVVGYGQQVKKDVTGVVTAVDAEEFNKGAIVSADQLITGKVAGVQIQSNSGEPGGQTTIRIRGGTSINASNEPLYVIDGVPIDNSAHNPGGFQSGKNPLNSINPNDIESFTVLKDASAAAIYGSRAANGVIIITTKKGDANDDGRITYDGWVSVANAIDKIDVLNAEEFRQVVSEQAPDRLNFLGNANTDWQDELLQTAIGQNHALSLSGGTDKIGYRASLGYLDQEGILKGSDTERASLALNYNHRMLDDLLKVDANFKASHTSDNFVQNGVIGKAIQFDPTQPVLDPNSVWGGFFEYENDQAPDNPVAEQVLVDDEGTNFRSIGNIQFDYELPFVAGLSAKLNLGYDINMGDRKRFKPNNLREQSADNGEIRLANFKRTSTLLETYLNYKHSLDGINSAIDVTGGYSYQDFSSEFPEIRAWDLSSNLLGFNSTAPANNNQSFNTVLDNRLISFFGRVNYALMDKYLLTVTVRRDGSSRFGESDRWGTFPSAAVAWRISDESFLSGTSSVLSDLKLRLGWGITGNQEIGDFRFLPTYTFGNSTAQYQFGDRFVTTLRPDGVDPNLKWEETASYNAGLDFGLFSGKVSGSVEYYVKETSDLLSEVTVPAGSNLTNIILTNIGSVENKGFEFSLNTYAISTENVSWNIGFNIAKNKNEITKLTNFNDPNFQGIAVGGISGGVGNKVQILKVGYPVNSFFLFQHKTGPDGQPLVDNVDHNEDGATNLADIYEDTNSDGQVNDLDKVPFEKPAPDVTLGLTSLFYYKNLDVSFTVRGSFGNYVYNNVASNGAYYNRVITQSVPTNMVSTVQDLNFVAPQYFSNVFVEDASFVRMDNLTLGYTLNEIAEKLKLRVYGTVQNLFTITDYTGIDPEIGNVSGKNDEPKIGIDDNVFPRSRTFMVGLSLEF